MNPIAATPPVYALICSRIIFFHHMLYSASLRIDEMLVRSLRIL